MQRYVVPIILLILAGALQGNTPGWLSIGGAKPDFLLVVLIATALMRDPLAGAVLGFVAGLIHGSIVGPNLGSYIISRTIIGFLAGMVTIRLFSDNPIVPVLSAGGLTLLGGAGFFLANPPSNLLGALGNTFFTALLNSMLTLLAFWFLRWLEVRKKIKMANARL